MKTEIWIVSAWKRGKDYGFSVGKNRAQIVEDRDWKTVWIELEDGRSIAVKITPCFWRKCPELRHREIGRWLEELGRKSWPLSKPHKFILERLSLRHFRISLLEEQSA